MAGLDLRHRQHARVEDRIRQAKATGCGTSRATTTRPTKRGFEIVMTAMHLVAWSKLIGFTDEPDLATCEIATFRYRVLARRRPAQQQRPANQAPDRPDLAVGRTDHPSLATDPRRVHLTPVTQCPTTRNPNPRKWNRRQPDTTVGPTANSRSRTPYPAAHLNHIKPSSGNRAKSRLKPIPFT